MSLVSLIAPRVSCLGGIKSTQQQRYVCVCFLLPYLIWGGSWCWTLVWLHLPSNEKSLSQVQRLLNIAPSGRGGSGVAMQQQMLNQQQGNGAGGREPAVGRFLLPVADCSFTLESVLEVGGSSLAAVSGGILVRWSKLQMCHNILRICKRIRGLSPLIPVWQGAWECIDIAYSQQAVCEENTDLLRSSPAINCNHFIAGAQFVSSPVFWWPVYYLHIRAGRLRLRLSLFFCAVFLLLSRRCTGTVLYVVFLAHFGTM